MGSSLHFHKEPVPFPKPQRYQREYADYEEAAELEQNAHNDLSNSPHVQWDAWVDVMKEGGSKPLYYDPAHEHTLKMVSLGRIGLSFEDYDTLLYWQESQGPVDTDTLTQLSDGIERNAPRYQYYHAFSQGYLQQQRIINRMYDNQISFYGTFGMVGDALDSQPLLEAGTPRDLHELFNQRVRNLGQRGLDSMDYARGYIEKWAREVYLGDNDEDEGKRDAFRMGHGTALMGARLYHERMNDLLIQHLQFDELDPQLVITKNSSRGTREKQ